MPSWLDSKECRALVGIMTSLTENAKKVLKNF